MEIKCPKCNRSEDVVLDDGPYFQDEPSDGVYADFVCETCDILFRADFGAELFEIEILEEGTN